MQKVIILIILQFLAFSIQAQGILVKPLIQDISEESATIVWETTTLNESTVQWGIDSLLENVENGTSITGSGTSRIHHTTITGLFPGTKYYYKAITGSYESEVLSFKTLPEASSSTIIKLAVISDCQYDSQYPGKLSEVINDGIVSHFQQFYGVLPEDGLQAVVSVGDQVNTGSDIIQYRDQFFANTENLTGHVCLFPVMGNHDNNSSNYFNYFSCPLSGSPGYDEHWYFRDMGNIRLVVLNSTTAYQLNEQLNWLSTILEETRTNDTIDFVLLAQHHPYHSELWLPGETDWGRKVIDSLSVFSNVSGKPSVFFFGHTHGYSRGQQKDSRVLLVNAATASGYIDTWGSTEQTDYDEFNVSHDEYGFMMVEATDGASPVLIVKRYTRGDAAVSVDNQLQDSILLNRFAQNVPPPECIFPITGGIVAPECVILTLNEDIANHPVFSGSVEFQLSTEASFGSLVSSTWKHKENWYFDVNTMDSDVFNEHMVSYLEPWTQYYWRARIRSKNLEWSDWSEIANFSTGPQNSTGNLVVNGGAEFDTNNWTVVEGFLESLQSGECAGTTPHTGNRYFGVGGLCTESAFGEAYQQVDVGIYNSSIDAGICTINWGGYLSDYAGSDIPEISLRFNDFNGQLIEESNSLSSNSTVWEYLSENSMVPVGTRTIDFMMRGTRNSGTDNDCYVDDLFLALYSVPVLCNEYLVGVESLHSSPAFTIFPNPVISTATIFTPAGEEKMIDLMSISGQILSSFTFRSNSIQLDMNDMPGGLYLIKITFKNGETVAQCLNKM